jgi:hypothetical protein
MASIMSAAIIKQLKIMKANKINGVIMAKMAWRKLNVKAKMKMPIINNQ